MHATFPPTHTHTTMSCHCLRILPQSSRAQSGLDPACSSVLLTLLKDRAAGISSAKCFAQQGNQQEGSGSLPVLCQGCCLVNPLERKKALQGRGVGGEERAWGAIGLRGATLRLNNYTQKRAGCAPLSADQDSPLQTPDSNARGDVGRTLL